MAHSHAYATVSLSQVLKSLRTTMNPNTLETNEVKQEQGVNGNGGGKEYGWTRLSEPRVQEAAAVFFFGARFHATN